MAPAIKSMNPSDNNETWSDDYDDYDDDIEIRQNRKLLSNFSTKFSLFILTFSQKKYILVGGMRMWPRYSMKWTASKQIKPTKIQLIMQISASINSLDLAIQYSIIASEGDLSFICTYFCALCYELKYFARTYFSARHIKAIYFLKSFS